MTAIRLIHAATAPLPAAHAWAYAVGAPYHVAHGFPVDTVLPADDADFQQVMLQRDWGIEGRDDLIAQLDSLGDEGHRRRHGPTLRYYALLWRPRIASLREEYRAVVREGGDEAGNAAAALWRLDAVQADTAGIRSSPLLAFDAARAVMLARAGLMVGWLGEDETWPYLLAVARDVQRTYASWAQYGADFVLSRNVWAGDAAPDVFDEVVALLLAKADSPWRTLPWTQPLGASTPTAGTEGSPLAWSLEGGA